MKKSIIALVVSLLFVLTLQPVYASDSNFKSTIEYLDDGSYYETVIETVNSSGGISLLSTNTTTKSKTTYFKNSSGTTIWYVKVTGTFKYGNGSATCTSSSVTAKSNSNAWKITSKSASKSSNKATAKATAKKYVDGVVIDTKSKTVTLTCSPTGSFS